MPAERGPSGTGHERPPVAVPGPAPVPHPDEDRHGPHPSTEGAADPVVSPADTIRLRVTPITLREANAYVAANHRHHGETRGCIVVCACADEADTIRGVGIVGRPVARLLQDGYTAEVTRLCTDGTPNACSMLYRALWRAVRALGYGRLVTYTLPEEGGGSLRAAGFKLVGQAGGGTWDRPNTGRPRVDLHPTQGKLRWEVAG